MIATPPGRLRVGLMPRDVMTGMSIDDECVAAVERTGQSLASLGHDVELSHPAALDGLLIRMFPHVQSLISVVALAVGLAVGDGGATGHCGRAR